MCAPLENILKTLTLSPTLRSLALLVTVSLPWVPASAARAVTDTGPGRVIVKLRPATPTLTGASVALRVSAGRAQQLALQIGSPLEGGRRISALSQVVTSSTLSSQALIDRLSQLPDVAYAVPDYKRYALGMDLATADPNDPLYSQGEGGSIGQWYLKAPTAEWVSAINAPGAWRLSTGRRADGQNERVAVIDSGVRAEHPDLAGKTLGGHDLIGRDPLPNTNTFLAAHDGDGRDANPEDPGDALTMDDISAHPAVFQGCDITDSSWHGTEVSGLIGAATNNGVGMTGLGWHTQVLPIRVLGRCGGYDSDILIGMRWAAGVPIVDDPQDDNDTNLPANPHPARILNLSLGGPTECTQEQQETINAIAQAGVLIVAAAGNSYGQAVSSPARCAGVLAVGGVTHLGYKAAYTDLGAEVAISAPSGDIPVGNLAAYPIVTLSNNGSQGPGASIYTSTTVRPTFGTSFSAPLVSAAAALLWAKEPNLTATQIKTILQQSARGFPAADGSHPACQAPPSLDTTFGPQTHCACTPQTCGAGLLDVGAALTLLDQQWPKITVTPEAVVVGTPVTLTGSAGTGFTAASYTWAVLDAGTGGVVDATSLQNANTATATITPKAPGPFTVQLTITDTTGKSHVLTRTVLVTGSSDSADSGGGGGGAASAIFLGLLGAAAATAARLRRRQ